jgi:DNA polymerase-1
MNNSTEKFLIIDGSSMLYRAYFALPHFFTKTGAPTGAIYGFLQMMLRLIKDENPSYIVVAFDRKAPTIRHKEYAEYKANRPPMPDELSVQFKTIHEVLDGFDIPFYEIDGYEADDIISTIVEKIKDKDISSLIVTGDMDLAQVISDKAIILITRRGVSGIERFDRGKLKESLGISPEQVPDYKALVGDPSDNIQGIRGIGPKTALKILDKYGSVNVLAEHIETEHLEEYKEIIIKNKLLCTLIKDVPINFDLENAKVVKFDGNKLKEILVKLEFKNIMKELSLDQNNLDFKGEAVKNRVGLYFETSKEKPFSFAVADYGSEMEYKVGEELFTDHKSLDELKAILSDETCQKEVFDLKQLLRISKQYNILVKNVHLDVSLIAYLLNPELSSYSQESLSKIFSIPLNGNSAGARAKFVYDLANNEESLFVDKDLIKLYEQVEKPFSEVLLDMEETGLKIDVPYFKELKKEVDEELKKLEVKIYNLAGISFNILSSKQLSSILYDVLGLQPSKRIKTGFSTASNVLEDLINEHPIIPFILQYRSLSKLSSTYIEALPHLVSKEDGKLHTHFHQIGTATGRLRSSDPNIQNIPIRGEWGEKIRKAFVSSDKDHFLISADYSQIELRILAHMSQDKSLLEAFKNDEDIHLHTASTIFGVDERDVSRELRNRAKAINFGIIYGISPYGLSKQIGCSQEEAADYIEKYFAKYQGVKEFIEELIKQTSNTGETHTILGRLRRIKGFDSPNYAIRENARRIAINSPIQGSAADIIKIAMLNIYREIKEIDVHILVQIHDELIIETNRNIIADVIETVKEKMENAYNLDAPLKVNIGYGYNLSEVKI